MLKRLQRVQNACAAFVLGKFATVNDVISLKWLPVRVIFVAHAIRNVCFKSLAGLICVSIQCGSCANQSY